MDSSKKEKVYATAIPERQGDVIQASDELRDEISGLADIVARLEQRLSFVVLFEPQDDCDSKCVEIPARSVLADEIHDHRSSVRIQCIRLLELLNALQI